MARGVRHLRAPVHARPAGPFARARDARADRPADVPAGPQAARQLRVGRPGGAAHSRPAGRRRLHGGGSPPGRRCDRPVQAGATAGPGRHGRNVAGAPGRWALQRLSGCEDPASIPGAGRGARALPPRRPDRRQAVPPQHRAALRRRRYRGRPVLPGVRIHRWRAHRPLVRCAPPRRASQAALVP